MILSTATAILCDDGEGDRSCSDGNILSYIFWNYIFMLWISIVFACQVIFSCSINKRTYGSKAKAETTTLDASGDDNATNDNPVKKAAAAPVTTQQPQNQIPRGPPPVYTYSPDDTLHNVTSIALDNEPSIFHLSDALITSRTPLPTSMMDAQTTTDHQLKTSSPINST